jgi:hypothetical protein
VPFFLIDAQADLARDATKGDRWSAPSQPWSGSDGAAAMG